MVLPYFFTGGGITVRIVGVVPHSPADKAGIVAGDLIVGINKNEINDVLDYDFHTAAKKLTVTIHRGDKLFDVKIVKGEYDSLGCEFETFLMDNKHSCKNGCIFCFVDQNPKGMRDTVYFKDDDSRMSFLSGSYVTLTNMSDADVERIIKMHISPIYISVHTTDPVLRVKMLRNKNAGACLEYLKRFSDAGIWMNLQIVLCPDWNDGAQLEKTLSDLEAYIPAVQSIAVVPVGLTKHRDGLCPLRPFTPDESRKVIATVDGFGDRFVKEYGSRICFASDEFYLSCNMPVPDDGFYEDYPQLDNGVGLIRSLLADVDRALEFESPKKKTPRPFSIVTGYAAYDCIKAAAKAVCEKLFGGDDGFLRIYRIRNDFFGESVTVAGLVTGGDIMKQLSGKDLGERMVIPRVMLRYEQDMFLDDVTPKELENTLGVPVCISDTDGDSFVSLFLSED